MSEQANPEDPVRLSVIVVNYNTRDLTIRCLRVLAGELADETAEILVVDNASSDGSSAAIQDAFPAVRVVANPHNSGFGAANNLLMRQAKGQYFLLLNSDAFPLPGAVRRMMDYLASHLETGAVGPRLLNEDRSLQQSCFRFPSPLQSWLENLWISALWPRHRHLGDYRRWAHHREREVDFVIGACIMIRREVYETVGGFDERFFMYQEEADWQLRIHDAGWKVVFLPSAEVVHLGGGSSRSASARVNHYFFESLDKYQLIHHGLPGFLLTRAAMLVGCSLRLVLWMCMALLVRSQRERALQKARKHAWLVHRQLLTGLPTL